MTKILEFLSLVLSPDLTFFVILGLDPRISSQRILKFPASLRKFRHCEALKKEGAISSNRRHCEGAKRPKQSRSKFRLKFRHCRNSVIAEIAVIASEAKQSHSKFRLKFRHCRNSVIASEAKQSHQIAIIPSENSKILAGF